ncbi:glycosyltransferase family 8 protein [Paenibacillus rhizophilus]|uniref:Glycosyltransferase family 8 protein n=1 Tax=Paenibacillus rhizophilus TaxID=1850366 RepID=A0A3N9Q4U1_9BACL|nr:glycosyltransferase family 8 protein [Paenibacillus rhizophilus]RQW12536.1 glycosyltransferase family 8 protein [Paenibacillus rhizophilus]
MIELVLAFHDKDGKYAEHAGVVLASVFHNTNSPINVHILHDETLNEENQRKLIELATGYNQTINFYSMTLPYDLLQVMAGIGSINAWTQACMYRLLLPALIPVDKIIYLDCDVLVNMDIAELWQVDLGEGYLAAIKDQGIMEVAHIISSKGLNPELYFNSGVILFSLSNIRKNVGWYEETLNFFRNSPDTSMPDQDALNVVYGRNYVPLDLRFNLFSMGVTDHDFNNKIVHFAGTEKCWDNNSSGAELYRNYLDLTPWRQQAPENTAEADPPEVHPAEVHPEVQPFEAHPVGVHPPVQVHPAHIHPANTKQKIRKRKTISAKRYRKRMNNTTSYNNLKRRGRKVSQGKLPYKRSDRMKGRRTETILISLDSLKLIRQSGRHMDNQSTETSSTPFLPLRKFN